MCNHTVQIQAFGTVNGNLRTQSGTGKQSTGFLKVFLPHDSQLYPDPEQQHVYLQYRVADPVFFISSTMAQASRIPKKKTPLPVASALPRIPA